MAARGTCSRLFRPWNELPQRLEQLLALTLTLGWGNFWPRPA